MILLLPRHVCTGFRMSLREGGLNAPGSISHRETSRNSSKVNEIQTRLNDIRSWAALDGRDLDDRS